MPIDFLRSTVGSLLICSLVAAAAFAQTETPVEPFFRARDQRAEYAGPGRDDPPTSDPGEVLIGYFGPDDPEHPAGGAMWRAAQRAVDEANRDGGYRGKPFRLVAAWSENPWGTGVGRLARLAYQDRVWAILGGIDGPTTHLAEQVVAKARLPLVSPVSTDKTVNLANVPWMFSLAPGDHLIAPLLADEIACRLGEEDLVIVSADDHDSQLLAVESLRALKTRKISPQYRFTFRRDETELEELVGQIVEARPGCTLLIADASNSAVLVKRLRAAGCTGHIFGGPAMGRHQFLEMAGDQAERVVFPQLYVPTSDAPADFDYAAAHTYDAARLLIAAIRRAGLNRAEIGDALRENSPTQGITGTIRWDGLGSNTRGVTLATIRHGKIVRRTADVSPPVPHSQSFVRWFAGVTSGEISKGKDDTGGLTPHRSPGF